MRNVTKYLSMLMVILSILVFASQTKAQTTLMTQNWNTASGTTPPAGWAIDQLGYGSWTSFITSGGYPTCTPYEGSTMVGFNSWNASTGYQNRLYMTTPINTLGYTNITVDFAEFMQTVFTPGDGPYVEWSTNGTVWTVAGGLVYNYAAVQGWQIKSQVLPAGAASATLYIALRFYSNYGYDVYTDLYHITGLQTGNLTGTVRNCYNNALIVGAQVTCGGITGVTNAAGVYTLNAINTGSQIITATMAGFLQYNAPVTVIGNTTTTVNFCMNPIPGILSGVVTNAATGNPVIGAYVTFGGAGTYSTGANIPAGTPAGYYKLSVYPGATGTVQCTKPGWANFSQAGITVTPPATTPQNIALNENAAPASTPFTAVLNAGQTSVALNWGMPKDDMVLLYDDGIQDNFVIWATGGGSNMNAMRFTPISYPCVVKGFYVNIGQATNYTAGQNAFSPVQMAIYSEVGGLPGAQLSAPTTVTPAAYGWTKANFDAAVTIPSGNFFIVMIQLGSSVASPGLGVDTTVQQLRSYSKVGSTPWIPGPGNYMLRAVVNGSGGPLMLGGTTGGEITASAVPGLTYQYSDRGLCLATRYGF
ncbi:MAG: hypothetical protein NTU98_12820 [Bacteroidetes bacterium]|nr:hypothetical protein [Bacteroidota bacterium]